MGLDGRGKVFIQHTFQSLLFLRHSIFFYNFGHVRCSYGHYFLLISLYTICYLQKKTLVFEIFQVFT